MCVEGGGGGGGGGGVGAGRGLGGGGGGGGVGGVVNNRIEEGYWEGTERGSGRV